MIDVPLLLMIAGGVLVLGVVGLLLRYGSRHLQLAFSDRDSGDSGGTPPPGFPALDFKGHLEAGNRLYQEYRYRDAMLHYSRAARLKPREAKVHFRIGRLYLALKEDEKAKTAFQKVLSLQANSVEALFELGRLYLQHKQLPAAMKHVDQMLKIRPGHLDALKLKVRILLEGQNYAPAETLLQSILIQEPGNIDLLTMLAWCQQKTDRWEESIVTYQQILLKAPDDRRNIKYQIYLTYEKHHHLDLAIATLQDILASGSGTKDQDSLKSELARCCCNRAIRLMNDAALEEAIGGFQEALAASPQCLDAHLGLGRLYKGLQQWPEATQSYQAALRLDPSNYMLYMEVAALFEQQNQLEEAVAYMETAEALAPIAKVYYYLGTLYGMQGEMSQCISHLNKALRKDPHFVDAYYNLGVALEREGDYQEAANAYRKVLSLDKGHEEAQANLAALGKKYPLN